MKLCCFVPLFGGGGWFIYSHDGSHIESLFSCIAWENSQLNHRSGEKGRELLPSSDWRQFPALLSSPAVEPKVHINDQHSNFQFRKLKIINRTINPRSQFLIWFWERMRLQIKINIGFSPALHLQRAHLGNFWIDSFGLGTPRGQPFQASITGYNMPFQASITVYNTPFQASITVYLFGTWLGW